MHCRNNHSCVLPILLSCGLLIISEPYVRPFILKITSSQGTVGYGHQARNQCWTSSDLSLWWYPPKSNLRFYISYQRAFLMCSRSFLFFWLYDQNASAFFLWLFTLCKLLYCKEAPTKSIMVTQMTSMVNINIITLYRVLVEWKMRHWMRIESTSVGEKLTTTLSSWPKIHCWTLRWRALRL